MKKFPTRLIGVFLTVVMIAALFSIVPVNAADANHNGTLTVTDVVIARNDLLSDTTLDSYNQKSVTLNQIDYRIVGCKNVTGEGTNNETVKLTTPAAGFVVNVNAIGDVAFKLSGGANNYITVLVDGEEIDRQLGASGNVVVAQDLEPGIHEIGVYTQTEGQTLTVSGLSFCGETDEIDDGDLMIEFIGDSISAAFGNLWDQSTLGNQNATRHQNTFWGYGPIVARTLGANYAMLCTSGSVLINDPACSNTGSMQKKYNASYYANNRKADITFISLGGNDCKVLPYMFDTEAEQVEFFTNQAMIFARTIAAANGPNAKIVFWQSGGLDYATYRASHYPAEAKAVEGYNSIRKAYTKAVEELAKEGITAYLAPDTPCDIRGLYIHPLVDGVGGHKDIAERIVTFLKENVINN